MWGICGVGLGLGFGSRLGAFSAKFLKGCSVTHAVRTREEPHVKNNRRGSIEKAPGLKWPAFTKNHGKLCYLNVLECIFFGQLNLQMKSLRRMAVLDQQNSLRSVWIQDSTTYD